MNDFDDEDECEGEVVATFTPQPIGENLQILDLIGHGFAMSSNIFNAIAVGCAALGQDFFRAGRKRRHDQIDRDARREMAASLARIVDGDS